MMTAAILFFVVALAAMGLAAKNEFNPGSGIVMKAEGDGGSGGGGSDDWGGWDDTDLPF